MLEINAPEAYEMGLAALYGTPCPFVYSDLEQAWFEGQCVRFFEQGYFIWGKDGQWVMIDNKLLKIVWSER